ncbi:MAG: prepilin-type N-terminal cleavage/methylation domain-containing protein [Tabrizicola sp.]|jgi:prepilin-type N-terminal cleavage/methylation domain-containing protein|nr:prepilin-type N-terminal cleavage/methylation domain-containing protein [Tabrizicola sp.]
MTKPVLNARSGLSLLELLLALALLAVIAGGLVGTVGLGIRLNDRTSALAERQDPLAARRLLRDLLQSALPPDRITPFDPTFQGDAVGFTFVTLAGRSLAPDAAAIRVAVTVQGADLVMTVEMIPDEGESRIVLTTLLASGAESVDISYFDRRSDPPGWIASWEDDTRLPDLVRVEIPAGSQPDWPEFTVSPALRD